MSSFFHSCQRTGKMAMAKFLQLIFIVLACISITKTAAQVICATPLEIGELRVKNSKHCVNIHGTEGRGDVNTDLCDGNRDQELIMCEDGTIRNTNTPNNCISPGTNGKGNVESVPCEVYPAIPDYQKWRYGRSKTFVDSGGIRQVAREIINVKSGQCLNVHGSDGTGDINTDTPDNRDDQYFYFRSRGKLVAHGRLQVQKSGLCLDVAGTTGGRGKNVFIGNCENSLDQYYNFYENGELINKKSRLCLNVEGFSGVGDVDMYPCDDKHDQMWSRPKQYCQKSYCAFRNKKSGRCINVHGYAASKGSDVNSDTCEGEADQLFRWVNESWVTPTAKWNMVGCNQNGEITQTISNTVSYTTSISTSVSVEVSAAIEADTVFGSASVTTTVSTSLAHSWEESYSGTREISYTCSNYDSGEEFTGGCMWQLQVTTKQTTNDDILKWAPHIVKCTSRNTAPTCPPFTRCGNEECTQCEDLTAAQNDEKNAQESNEDAKDDEKHARKKKKSQKMKSMHKKPSVLKKMLKRYY